MSEQACETPLLEEAQKFFVEHAKGFYWVTERATNHNYAQTDSKERADQICRDLNNGVTEFEEDGYPAADKQCVHGFIDHPDVDNRQYCKHCGLIRYPAAKEQSI